MFNVPGRPTGSLRGPRSWFSLFAHRHLHVISHSFSPQFGVQENPRAREGKSRIPVVGLPMRITDISPSLHSLRAFFLSSGSALQIICFFVVVSASSGVGCSKLKG